MSNHLIRRAACGSDLLFCFTLSSLPLARCVLVDIFISSIMQNSAFVLECVLNQFVFVCVFSLRAPCAAEYEVGTPEPNTPCTFTVHTGVKRTGVILSPTYPGVYPKDLTCSYQFIGTPGQRVRLEFRAHSTTSKSSTA